jgi:putative pyruvate formate lyase activating enzyme
VNYLEPLKRNLYLAASEGLPVVVRHVVMPGHLECCTRPALETITQIIPSAWVHLMPYLPAWQGAAYGLEGFSTQADLREACNMATSINLSLWKGTPI